MLNAKKFILNVSLVDMASVSIVFEHILYIRKLLLKLQLKKISRCSILIQINYIVIFSTQKARNILSQLCKQMALTQSKSWPRKRIRSSETTRLITPSKWEDWYYKQWKEKLQDSEVNVLLSTDYSMKTKKN